MGFFHSKGKRAATGRALIVRDDARQVNMGQAYQGGPTQEATLREKLKIHVVPDDGGPEFESTTSFWGGDYQDLRRGFWTYVRYDPADPAECDIDGERLLQEFGKVNGKHRRVAFPEWASGELTQQRKLPAGATFDPLASVQVTSVGGDGDVEAPAPGAGEMVAGLKDLTELHATGALTDAEFAEAKSRLLGHG